MMAIVAEDNEIIVLVVGPIAVNVISERTSIPFMPQIAQESSVSR